MPVSERLNLNELRLVVSREANTPVLDERPAPVSPEDWIRISGDKRLCVIYRKLQIICENTRGVPMVNGYVVDSTQKCYLLNILPIC
jgi:hypothetical protein